MHTQTFTIFIHGTLPPASRLPFLFDFFFCPEGLTHAYELPEKFHLNRISRVLESSNSTEFPRKQFYLFGWSGKLSYTARKEAASHLLSDLLALKKQAEANGTICSFKIITHSHGGNVALYLAEILKERGTQDIVIDELILLACPVQMQTEEYAHADIFKRVFSIHSHKDMLQVLDPQGIHTFLESLRTVGLECTLAHLKELGPVFSARHFKAKENITQLYIAHPNREFLHIEFLLPHFLRRLPDLLTNMREHKTTMRNSDEITYIFS